MSASILEKLDEQKALLVGISRKMRGHQKVGPEALLRKTLIKALIVSMASARSSGFDFEFGLKTTYPGDPTLKSLAQLARSSVQPALTSVAGWAAELVQDGVNPSLLLALAPQSVVTKLAAMALRVDLAASPSPIRFPYSVPGAIIPTPFIAEGDPIPLRTGHLSSLSLVGKKASVISVYTSELMKRSVPTIETIVSRTLGQDIARSIDNIFLSDDAATAWSPGGVLVGATDVPASTATDPVTAAAADISALIDALSNPAAATSPVLIVSPGRAAFLALSFPGSFPVIASEFAGDRVIALDCDDLVIGVEPGSPDISVTKEAVLHEDSNALAISTPGAPNVVAAPTRSLYQTDCLALRLVENLDWRSSTVAAVVTGPAW
ncbi:phage major capsid protein [Ensifer sp. ENS02]|uniref:phage major capsid protein n=1 Tax=Ensifer sp. ENS02 TaxID=2769290 RepID=UPI0017836C4C|nr:phage major capsid protein [Ensifer sp. ENS02]MBD9522419.1 phage major capsid protein [Ensifer sp. ENS02]